MITEFFDSMGEEGRGGGGGGGGRFLGELIGSEKKKRGKRI